MSCTNCPQVEFPCCATRIVLGEAPSPMIQLWLSIEDVTNNRLVYLPVQYFGGTIYVDIDVIDFANNHSFIFKLVCPMETDSWTTGIEWTLVDGITKVTCVQVGFNKIQNNNEGLLHAGEITITKQW
tara:strand:+ start:1073 stop:1453 length:381 start_codon:yes stop_codon:yes gene_type:complete